MFTLILFLVISGALGHNAVKGRWSQDFTYLGTSLKNSSRDFDPNNYYISVNPTIWSTAVQDCRNAFGPDSHLISIESKTESDALNAWLQNSGANSGSYWTSGEFDIGQDVWKWGGNLETNISEYSNWGPGEPDSNNGKQRILLNYQNELYSDWESEDDTFSSRYICEVGTESEQSTTTTPTTTTEPEPPMCTSDRALIIVLEATETTGTVNFNLAKEFVAELASSFTSVQSTKFGFITYALSVHTNIQLHDSLSESAIQAEILKTELEHHDHRLKAEGILHAKVQLETYSKGSPRRMIVITNGISDHPSITKNYADHAYSAGIEISAVGIGNGADAQELLDIAHGDSSRVFTASWDNLASVLAPLVQRVCP